MERWYNWRVLNGIKCTLPWVWNEEGELRPGVVVSPPSRAPQPPTPTTHPFPTPVHALPFPVAEVPSRPANPIPADSPRLLSPPGEHLKRDTQRTAAHPPSGSCAGGPDLSRSGAGRGCWLAGTPPPPGHGDSLLWWTQSTQPWALCVVAFFFNL